MKKSVLSFLMSIILAFLCFVGVSAEENLKVGKKINGFTLIETDECKLFDADTYLFEHNSTGGKLLYIANDDVNRAFNITFNTPAEDTGVSHVFEHASLNGSKKYPANIFFNISFETINTYLNASTAQKYTNFPISSISDEQLLKLADYYLDGVFNPLILTNKDIFEQEAWRYELESPDSELVLNGTVYSEMKGAISPYTKAIYNSLKLLYPGSHNSAIFGGDPEIIPSLTYEDLVKYHSDYYRPSNSLVILYGKVDYEKYLKLVNEYFSEYDNKKVEITDPDYKPVTKNIEDTFSIQAPEMTGDIVHYLIPCNISEERELFDFLFCTKFINNSSALLKQNVKKEMPNVDISAGAEFTVGVNPTLLIVASNVQAGDESRLKEIIDASFAEIAETGFSEKLTDAFLASIERDNLLAPENSGNRGISIIDNINAFWSVYGRCDTYFNYIDYCISLDKEAINDNYKKLVKKYFVNPTASVFTVNVSDTSLGEKADKALAEKLAAKKASMTDGEIAEIVRKTAQGKDNSVNRELVDKINVSNVDILRKDIDSYKSREYACSDVMKDGVRYLSAEADIGDIGYTTVYIDVSNLSDEQLLYLNLFDNIFLKFGTTEHTQSELYELVSRYIAGSSSLMVAEDDLYMIYDISVLNKDIEKMYDVLYEMLYDVQFNDVEYLKSVIENSINGWETTVFDEGIIISRAKAQKNAESAYLSYMTGLDYYQFLKDVRKKLDENPSEVIDNLNNIKNTLKNRNNAKSIYAGNKEGIELTNKFAKEFFDKLDDIPKVKVNRNIPVPEGNEGIISNTDINYNLIYAPLDELGISREGSLAVTLNMMNDKFFMPYLRNEKGAYGVLLGLDDNGMYICSYRDPQISSTFDYYDKLSDILGNTEFSQEEIDGYIMSTFSKSATKRKGLLSGAYYALQSKICGEKKSDYDRLREVLDTTPEKVKGYAPVFKKFAENGVRGTVGKKADIAANKDLYDNIIDPFADEIEIYFCGKKLYSDIAPIMENDHVLVPMRAIFEAMGCDVIWDEAEQKAIVRKDETEVIIRIGFDIMTVNGAEVILDTSARLEGERTFIPVRALSEAMEYTVSWDEADEAVVIE